MASLSSIQVETIIFCLLKKTKRNQTIREYIQDYPDRFWFNGTNLYHLDEAYQSWNLEDLAESAAILVVEGVILEEWLEYLILQAELVAKSARERVESQKLAATFIKRIEDL